VRLSALAILGLVALFLYAPQSFNIMLAGFGLLALVLLAIGSIGHDRGHR
jgi:fatty acid desaturase